MVFANLKALSFLPVSPCYSIQTAELEPSLAEEEVCRAC